MKNKPLHTFQMARACAGLCLAVFFWAINTVIARAVIFQIPPMTLSFYRWFVALVLILPFAIPHLKNDMVLIRHHLGYLFVLSVPSVAVYNSVLYLGAHYTTATNISLVAATMPIMTLLFSWMMNRSVPALMQALGIGISLVGMFIIITRGSWQVLLSLSVNPGDLLIVLSIASWAFYSVLLKKKVIAISPVSFLTVLIFLGLVCILPFYLYEAVVFESIRINFLTASTFLYLGIFPSILSYILWNDGVRVAGASVAAVFMYLLPVFTALIACFFLGERLFSYHLSGALMILIGLVLSVLKGIKKNPQ